MKKTDLRHFFSYLSWVFNLRLQIKYSDQKLIFPFYHAIVKDQPPHLKHLYPLKSIDEFVRDLEKLLRFYRPVSPEYLLQDRERHEKPGFILSFDDGLREIYDIVAPILEKKGISAIFFLNNSFIDNRAIFYRYKVSLFIDRLLNANISHSRLSKMGELLSLKNANNGRVKKQLLGMGYADTSLMDAIGDILEVDSRNYLENNKPYMTTEQILDLKDRGFFFGGHGFDHQEFALMDPGKQEMEIVRSVSDIRKRFDLNYSFFAFPFSDHGVSRKLIEKLLLECVAPVDALFGTGGFGSTGKLSHFQRLSMEKYQGDSERILKTEYLYYFLKKNLWKNA